MYTGKVQADKDILMRLGCELKALRKQKGLTQRALSQMSKVNRNYISGIERGERNVSILTLCELLYHLDSDIVTFISTLK